jgi:hypothetical protein
MAYFADPFADRMGRDDHPMFLDQTHKLLANHHGAPVARSWPDFRVRPATGGDGYEQPWTTHP